MTSGSPGTASAAPSSGISTGTMHSTTTASRSAARILAPSGSSRLPSRIDSFEHQVVDVHGQLLGNHGGRAGDLDLVDMLHDHAALAHAGRFAAQLDRHADLDDLVLGNPREIDVDDVRPPRVPLQIADEGRLVDRAGQADQPAAVPDGRRQDVGRHGQRHAFQAVSIQDRRESVPTAEAAGCGVFPGYHAIEQPTVAPWASSKLMRRPTLSAYGRIAHFRGKSEKCNPSGQNYPGNSHSAGSKSASEAENSPQRSQRTQPWRNRGKRCGPTNERHSPTGGCRGLELRRCGGILATSVAVSSCGVNLPEESRTNRERRSLPVVSLPAVLPVFTLPRGAIVRRSLILSAAVAFAVVLANHAFAAESVWLSSLDVGKTQQDWGKPQADKSVDGHTMTIAGTKYEHGLGTHAASLLYVDLKGGATRFTALVGVDDEVTDKPAGIRFALIGDGRDLWKSGVMKKEPGRREGRTLI